MLGGSPEVMPWPGCWQQWRFETGKKLSQLWWLCPWKPIRAQEAQFFWQLPTKCALWYFAIWLLKKQVTKFFNPKIEVNFQGDGFWSAKTQGVRSALWCFPWGFPPGFSHCFSEAHSSSIPKAENLSEFGFQIHQLAVQGHKTHPEP